MISLWYSIRNCFLSPDGDLKEETSNTEQLGFSERLCFHLKPVLWGLVCWTEVVGGRTEVTHHSLPSPSMGKRRVQPHAHQVTWDQMTVVPFRERTAAPETQLQLQFPS